MGWPEASGAATEQSPRVEWSCATGFEPKSVGMREFWCVGAIDRLRASPVRCQAALARKPSSTTPSGPSGCRTRSPS